MRWAQAAVSRDQLVLFSTKLDEIINHDDPVRAVDRVLEQVDWKPFEAIYDGHMGQPPIHPRILCGVILYGLICRIRASRKLEEALIVRTDFRWLAHGMSIDHSTISEFRRKHSEPLRDLFVQVVLIGREMGLVKFKRIGFDGTRVRSNNRKTGTRTPEQLRKAKQELAEQFDRLAAKADQEDEQDEESFGSENASSASPPLTDRKRLEELERMQRRVDAALGELKKIEQSAETMGKLMRWMPICIFGIVVLLIWQFNSFRRPLIIFITIPLAFTGGFIGLLIMRAPFDFFAMLGLLSLAGVIINNGIVLIDKIDSDRAEGLEPQAAVLNAALSRFRPILMTTVTTVLGLMPLILSVDPLFFSMAVILAFGLVFGTVLTLGVVPAIYAVLFRIKATC